MLKNVHRTMYTNLSIRASGILEIALYPRPCVMLIVNFALCAGSS